MQSLSRPDIFARKSLVMIFGSLVLSLCAEGNLALADSISPQLQREGKTYCLEPPNRQWYGTGISSRATEAFDLSLQAERDLQAGKIHDALHSARKAAQFDPGSAQSHLILARALSACVRSAGYHDKALYDECIQEWRLLRWHDADSSHQDEAAKQLALLRIGKLVSKVKAPSKDRPFSM